MSEDLTLELQPRWEYVADSVMGGLSEGQAGKTEVQGRPAMRLTGEVSTRNNGGFIQMAFDLKPDGSAFDASSWRGIAFELSGNGEEYDIRLRTDQLERPWQSFRTSVTVNPAWSTIRIDFGEFAAHRTSAVFDPAQLRRIGVLAIGREFTADVAVAGIYFYR
ncbi:CIA30 family protein [uncultured Roseobacter sp.]|uniref:CIA30 family protein n=1 Tax=uncultured Roseobacter sp. TaxID=114847 RepID=UPI00262F0C01|nr:CIA30 family protein [uncultured Roseobacter sp.]